MAKKIIQKTDSLNAQDLKRICRALRQIWHRSYSRNLVVKRCLINGGYSRCEKCKKKCPKVFVDHIDPIGAPNRNLIWRMFVPSYKLQGLCANCHKEKTKLDNLENKWRKFLNG
jgi:hypothetical protein